MESLVRPVFFDEKIIAMFWMNLSQIDTEINKNLQILLFSKIFWFFPKFSTDFGDWNVEKGQQGKVVQVA